MRLRLALLAGALVAVALAALAVQRGSGATVVADEAGGRPIVECGGWTGVTDGCSAWGARVLAAGPPTTTFEFEDVVRVRLDRPMFGLAASCVAEYYLGRYPDDVAWTEEIACHEG